MKGMNYGNDGDMKATVEKMQKPAASFSQSYDQAPLNYIERQNRSDSKAASKIKSQSYRGRYDK